MKKILLFLIVIILFGGSISAQNDQKQTEANFLYEFVRLLKFPHYFEDQVVVAVIGETIVIDYLDYMMNDNTVSGRTMNVNLVQLDKIPNCNIVFITKDFSDNLADILVAVENKNVLVVTEAQGYTQQGADISFAKKHVVSGDSTMSYKYNLKSIRDKKIDVSPEFIGFGQL